VTAQPDIEDYRHRVTETVRFSETDRLGHVNNTVFGIYLEVGRTRYFIDSGFYAQDRVALVIVKTEIQFAGMIYWPGEVEIGTRASGFGRTSFTMDQIILQEDRVVGMSNSTMVLIDSGSQKPTPLTEDIRSMLEKLG